MVKLFIHVCVTEWHHPFLYSSLCLLYLSTRLIFCFGNSVWRHKTCIKLSLLLPCLSKSLSYSVTLISSPANLCALHYYHYFNYYYYYYLIMVTELLLHHSMLEWIESFFSDLCTFCECCFSESDVTSLPLTKLSSSFHYLCLGKTKLWETFSSLPRLLTSLSSCVLSIIIVIIILSGNWVTLAPLYARVNRIILLYFLSENPFLWNF